MPYFNRRPIEELLQLPAAEVMSTFQLDMRRLTASIEGCTDLLREADLSEAERDHVIDVMSRNVESVRDGYNFILTYLEKLQESRKGDQ